MTIAATRSVSTVLILGASLILSGCSASPATETPAGLMDGPVAEVEGSRDWDPDEHPVYVPADDYIAPISSRYDTWAPGSAWRFSGDGWEPQAEVVVTVIRPASADLQEAVIGDPVTVKADDFGQFTDAYPLPGDVKAAGGYFLQAIGQTDGRIESSPLSIVNK